MRRPVTLTARLARDERGTILVITVVAMLLLSVLALSFSMVATLEGRMGINYHGLVKALHVADAGIEGVKKQDVEPWVNATAWTGAWNPFLQASGTHCDGSKQVTFNFTPADGAAWVRLGTGATLFIRDNDGAPGEDGNPCVDRDGIIMIRADGRLAIPGAIMAVNKPVALDLTVTASGGGWDNAVNGGTGAGGQINGNAMVFGGVSLVQTGGGVVWAMGGGSGVRNNYLPPQVSEQLSAGTRSLLNPAFLALGDIALNASFRVEQGTVTFSGGATVGLPQGAVTTRKETMDMALANDFDPGAIPEIYADVERQPNPPASSNFPFLAHVVGPLPIPPGDPRTSEVMMNQEGLHITQADLGSSVIDASLPGAVPIGGGLLQFCRPLSCVAQPSTGSCVTCNPNLFNLTIDPSTDSATLVVKGIIVFDNFPSGFGLQIGKPTTSDKLSVIVYSGAAVIFVDDANPANCITPGTACAGHVTVAADLKTAAGAYPTSTNPPTYPPAPNTVNNIAIVAERIGLARGADDSNLSGASQLTMTALFYAQTHLYSCKQNEIFGSLFSRAVTMSCNVPKIASVKTMTWFLPPGLIGSTPPGPGTLAILRWREGTQ